MRASLRQANLLKVALVTGNSREFTDKAAQLHNPIVDASAEAVAFSYIYFGSYPQSEVTGEELTSDIINAEYVSDDAVVLGSRYVCVKEGKNIITINMNQSVGKWI